MQLPDAKSMTTFGVIKDILIKCSLPLSQCLGHMFDGAPKKFKMPCDLSRIAATEVRIEEVEDLAVMQSVTVHVKAVLVGMPEHVQVRDSWRGLTKQECIVADATGTI